jgi:3-oxoacyl-[acyl-carrier protein] reductase
MEEPLRGRAALITGVSRQVGIGAAIARALAGMGADICTSYLRAYDESMPWRSDAAEAQQIVAGLQALGVRAVGIECDLADPLVPGRLMEQARQSLGHIDILVNNAAYSLPSSWDTFDAALLDRHYAVNTRGTALLCQAFARQHDGRAGGRIISMTSGQGVSPMPDELAYAATKAAVDMLTRSLSVALAPRGITVNAVDPGPTDTGWLTPDLHERLVARAPFGRIGLPEDTARLVGFLASDAGGWITGEIIRSRGGYRGD